MSAAPYREWVRTGPGDWSLYDKPRGQVRRPIGLVCGMQALGFLAYGADAMTPFDKFSTVPAAKRAVEIHVNQEEGITL